MGLSRRKFTREFKVAAVRRLEPGVSMTEVTRGLEVRNVHFREKSLLRERHIPFAVYDPRAPYSEIMPIVPSHVSTN